MEPESSEPPVLNYVTSMREQESHPGSWMSGASLVCALVPVGGLLMINGFRGFFLLSTLAAWIGAILGAIACFTTRRYPPDFGVALVSLVVNLAFAGFGLWFVMAHGIC